MKDNTRYRLFALTRMPGFLSRLERIIGAKCSVRFLPRNHSSVRRDMMSAKKTIAILILMGVVLFGALHPQNAIADDKSIVKSIVGSWVVQVFPNPPGPAPFKNLSTLTNDGGNLNSDPSFGGGHGAWKKVGHRKFAVKFLHFVPPGFEPNFPLETIITVSSDFLTLNKEGDKLRGPFQTVFTHPTTGEELASFDGTVVLTRITVGN